MSAQNVRKSNAMEGFSHVFNVGINHKTIFKDEEDYRIFINFIEEYLSPPASREKYKKTFTIRGRTFQGLPHQSKNYYNKVHLLLYVLAADHFHLVLQQQEPHATELFIRSLCTRYVIYYNKKYHTRGSLFPGPYKSAFLESDPQLLYLTHTLYHTHGDATDKVHSSYHSLLTNKSPLWITASSLLSAFAATQNDFLKGTKNFQTFLSHYEFTHEQQKQFEKSTIEIKSPHLAKSQSIVTNTESAKPTVQPKNPTDENLLPLHQRLPELGVAIGVFILLIMLGNRQVQTSLNTFVSPVKTTAAQDAVDFTDEDLTETEEEIQYKNGAIIIPITKEAKENEAQHADLLGTMSESQSLIEIFTPDKMGVAIRKEATESAELVAEAYSGELYSSPAFAGGWYSVFLSDETIGYIHEEFVKKTE